MSFHELSRRELQAKCKEYGLPANKSNAVMASSLTSFLGDPGTNVLARALPAAKKSVRARARPKTERLETSLASLILEATESRGVKPVKGEPEEVCGKRPGGADLAAFVGSSPAERGESVPQPKTAPLLRRRRKNDGGGRTTGPVELDAIASPSATNVVHDQGCQNENENERCCEEHVQPALRPLVFRISANVDTLIGRATAILRKFDEWKDSDKLATALS